MTRSLQTVEDFNKAINGIFFNIFSNNTIICLFSKDNKNYNPKFIEV